MSERYLSQSDWRPTSLRILLAGLLGHYAAACSFCATLSLVCLVNDYRAQGIAMFRGTTASRVFEVLWTTPLLIGVLGLWGAVLTTPTLLFTLPTTFWAALKLDTNALLTAAIGLLPGMLAGIIVFGSAPQIEVSIFICSAAGGAGFALVIWLLCIRPRQRYRRYQHEIDQGLAH